MKLVPLGDRVVLKQLEAEETEVNRIGGFGRLVSYNKGKGRIFKYKVLSLYADSNAG